MSSHSHVNNSMLTCDTAAAAPAAAPTGMPGTLAPLQLEGNNFVNAITGDTVQLKGLSWVGAYPMPPLTAAAHAQSYCSVLLNVPFEL